jgi:hypothetical protein
MWKFERGAFALAIILLLAAISLGGAAVIPFFVEAKLVSEPPQIVAAAQNLLKSIGLGFSLLFAVATIVRLMANYLSPRRGSFEDRVKLVTALERAKQAQKAAEELSTPTQTIRVNSEDRAAIVADTVERVSSALPTEVINQIRSTFEREFSSNVTTSSANAALARVFSRLQDASEEVRQRANLNLIMGTVTCALGVMLLLFIVFVFPQDTQAAWQDVLVRSLPRLTLVFIIELVGYFFLGLYRLGTYEVKFFQNEMTNIELWATSYIHAMRVDDDDLSKEVVKKLLSVERNFILKKGETTAFSPEADESSEGVRGDLRALIDLARTLKKKPEGKDKD